MRQLAGELDALGDPELARRAARAARARARRRRSGSAASGAASRSIHIARSTSAWRLRSTRWRDGHERRLGGPRRAARRGQVGARGARRACAARRVARAACSMPPLLASTRRAAANARSSRGARRRGARRCGRRRRRARRRRSGARSPRAQQRVAGRHRVVRVDEVVGELARAARAARGAAPAPPTRPTSRSCASAAARRSARSARRGRRAPPARVACEAQRGAGQLGAAASPRAGPTRCRTTTRTSAPGVARRERLAVGPDAEHRVVGARVELADDEDLHRDDRVCGRVAAASRIEHAPRSVRTSPRRT